MAVEIKIGTLLRLLSPTYGIVIYEVVSMGNHCGVCNGEDGVELEIVQDNNVGFEQSHGYHEPNERVGILVKTCMNTLRKELKSINQFVIIPDGEAAIIKQRIAEQEQ